MKRPFIFLLLLGAFWGLERIEASAAEDKPQTLFYLDDNRLITLRFQVTVDGKPFGEAWEKFLDENFQALDKNDDGKLSAQELERLNDRRLQQVLLFAGQASKSRPIPDNRTRKNFAESIEYLGIQPFAVNIESSQNQRGQRFTSLGMPRRSRTRPRSCCSPVWTATATASSPAKSRIMPSPHWPSPTWIRMKRSAPPS